MLTTIPFTGFYSSDHDALLDYQFEQMFQDDSGDVTGENAEAMAAAYDEMDWRKVHLAYAKMYAETFNDMLSEMAEKPLGMTFDELSSPREYNFTTDRIFMQIPEASVSHLYAIVDRVILADAIRDKFTSHSGFISSYDNSLEDWDETPVTEWDHNQVGTLIEAVFTECSGDYTCADNALDPNEMFESFRDNAGFDEMLYDALSAKGKAIVNALAEARR